MIMNSGDKTQASLIIFSEELPGEQIADKLKLIPTKIVLKGSPTNQLNVPEHPLHMAMFASNLCQEAELDKHIECVLDLCELHQASLLELKESCRITVHCSYIVHNEGGWTMSAQLCKRMGSLPLKFILVWNIHLQVINSSQTNLGSFQFS